MTSTTSLSYSNHSLDSTLKPLNCDAPSVNGLSSHSPERLLGSDVEDSSDEETRPPTVKGNLNKWTNILHGWQERYFVLKDGVLSYYRSEAEMDQGCRGSIRLRNAHVQAHPYDDCRIDVSLGDSTWYFRCSSESVRQQWISGIEKHRLAESGYSSKCSMLSLNSINSLSTNGKRSQSMSDKMIELERLKDSINRQTDRLQLYFDACHAIALEAQQNEFVLDSGRFQDILDRETLDNLLTPTPKSSFDESLVDFPPDGDLADADANFGRNTPLVRSARSTQSIGSAVEEDSPSSDEGGKQTPKATIYRAPSPPARGGFFSRLLPFRSSSNAGQSKTSDSVKSRANRESSNTRMHDLKLLLNQYGSYAVNFKVESLQFKATCSDMLMKLMQFTEAAQQREDYWRRRLERESERRRKAEDMVTGLLQDSATAGSHFRPFRANHIPTQAASILPAVRMGPGKAHQRSHSHGGAIGTLPTNNGMAVSTVTSNDVKMMLITEPGYQEGPDFNMAEEQFYDAIDAQLEKMRQDEAYLAALKSVGDKLRSANAMPSTHPLYNEVSKVCEERMDIFRGFPGPNDDGAACSGEGWNVVAKQGEMTIYNREVESADGNYLDPLQAIHTVHKVTAREMCEAFWDVQYRLDWEITIDHAPSVIEICGDNTVLQYQAYKRIWPATQRDSLFWSHIRRLDLKDFPGSERKSPSDDIVLDNWMVCNYSTKYGEDRIPASASPLIRIEVDVELFCQTVWTPPAEMQEELASLDLTQLSEAEFDEFVRSRVDRSTVRCRLLYASQINPGGWAPAAIVRTMAKREYPHFLQRISSFVISHTTDKQPHF
uniref:Collagen type IV alpha-3-binding protein n=1 Tax=Schistocephalus solidus TaxID=70667 RepID=A0A0X3P0E3_SCHSO